MNNNSKQRKVGIVLSYLQMALSIIIGLIYTPIMLKLLGQSEYGLYSTIISVISMLSILSLGFGSGYLKYYARYRAQDDWQSVWKLNGMFLLIFSIIGIVELIIGTILTFNLRLVFKDGLTAKEFETARVLMFMLTINLAISFPASVFNTIITANEKFIVHKTLQMMNTVVTPLMTIPLLLLGAKSIGLVMVTVFLSVITEIFNIVYVLKFLKNKFIFRNFEKGLLANIFAFTCFITINTIVRQVNWNVGKIILGRYVGTSAVAIYSVAFSLYVYYENFSTAISSVCRTKIHLLVNESSDNVKLQRKRLTEYFTSIGRLQFLVLGLILTGFIIFGRVFIVDIWVGSEYIKSYHVALLLIASSTVFLIQNLGVDIQRALDKHKFRSIIYVFMAIVNIVLTIVLCRKFNELGAALGTSVSILLVDGVIMNIYYHKKCNLDILFFWKSILRISIGVFLPLVIGLCVSEYLDFTQFWIFATAVLGYVILYIISIYFLSLKKEERLGVKTKLAKIKILLAGKV